MASQTTIDFEPLSVAVPLREDPPGVFRVGKSRALLELVIRAFQAGATPEATARPGSGNNPTQDRSVSACARQSPANLTSRAKAMEQNGAQAGH